MNPPNPYLISFFFATTIITCAWCQNDNILLLPSLELLQNELNTVDSVANNAEIEEYKDNYSFNWLNLAPSLSFIPVYDIKHDYYFIKPSLSFSISGLLSSLKEKRILKRKITSLESKYVLAHQNRNIRLIGLYNDVKNDLLELDMLLDIQKQYKALFEIKIQQYKANEINVEVYISSEIQYKERKRVVINQINSINTKLTEIELLVNTKVADRLNYSIVD